MANKSLRDEKIDNWGINQETGDMRFYGLGDNGSMRIAISGGVAELQELVADVWTPTPFKVGSLLLNTLSAVSDYQEGQIQYDPASKTFLADSGFTDVRNNIGQEEWFLVLNDTGSQIDNGKVCYAYSADETLQVLKAGLADNTSFSTSAQILGVATHDIPKGELGLITRRGIVRNFNTVGLTLGGLTYLSSNGNMTSEKPLYPLSRIRVAIPVKIHATEGAVQCCICEMKRNNEGRPATFTSADAGAGTHYRFGFYRWSTTSATLNQTSLSVNYGDANITRAAHIGIVPQATGSVDSGQVGLRVTGVLDSETGIQQAAQTAIITDDITTLNANEMIECIEKFSGTVTIELYVVSGSPTAYTLTFNYGYSKYEDFANIDATITDFSAVWEAGAADAAFNITLLKHTKTGWSYAATGFVPGGEVICNRLIDQPLASNLNTGLNGAYKRVNLNEFVNGAEVEGFIVKIQTSSPKTIRSMDMYVGAYSEELD